MQVPKLDIKLPSNARVLTHANQCYDWGTFGWLLRSGEVNVQKYKYFVLLNSSVRGPFLPPYVPVSSSKGQVELGPDAGLAKDMLAVQKFLSLRYPGAILLHSARFTN